MKNTLLNHDQSLACAMDVVEFVGLSLDEEAYRFAISFMGNDATPNVWHNTLMSILCGKDFPSFLQLFDYMYEHNKEDLTSFIKEEFDGYHYGRDLTFDRFVSMSPKQLQEDFLSLCQHFSEKTLAQGHSRHPFISSLMTKEDIKKELQNELTEKTITSPSKKMM